MKLAATPKRVLAGGCAVAGTVPPDGPGLRLPGRDAGWVAVVHDLQRAGVRQGGPGLGVRDLGPQAPALDDEAEREPGEPRRAAARS